MRAFDADRVTCIDFKRRVRAPGDQHLNAIEILTLADVFLAVVDKCFGEPQFIDHTDMRNYESRRTERLDHLKLLE